MDGYDVIAFLRDNQISFKQHGKNVTSGWVGIRCPYAGCTDQSFHCGINLKSGLHSCWVCGNKGNLPRLASKLLKINYYLAVDSLRKYLINPDTDDPEENRRHRIKNFSFLRKIPELHKAYLSSRKFDHKFLEQAYKIQYCYQVGRFPYRIVIPIIQDRRIVSFTARDVTGKQNEKYLHLSNEEGEVPVKSCLYNLDAVKNQAILCEGPMDVWRVGGPAIAGFGTTLSSAQLELLLATDIDKMYILFDADAKAKAEKLANDFSAFIQHVEVLYLKTGDPADLSQDQVLELKKQIGIDHE